MTVCVHISGAELPLQSSQVSHPPHEAPQPRPRAPGPRDRLLPHSPGLLAPSDDSSEEAEARLRRGRDPRGQHGVRLYGVLREGQARKHQPLQSQCAGRGGEKEE